MCCSILFSRSQDSPVVSSGRTRVHRLKSAECSSVVETQAEKVTFLAAWRALKTIAGVLPGFPVI